MQPAQRLGRENPDRGVAAGQADERQRLLERVPHVGHRLLLDRLLDHGRRAGVGLVPELQGGAAARLGIGTGELSARLVGIQERLDRDAQPPVGRDLDEPRQRHRAKRLPLVGGCDLDHLGVPLGGLRPTHHDLEVLAFAARVDVAVAERAQEVQPLRIARAADDVDRRLPLVRVVDGEIGEGLEGVGRLRVARRGAGEPRHEQQQEQTLHQAFF